MDASNTVIMKYYLETLLKVIGRRSSEKMALLILQSAIENLSTNYEFLKNIEIVDEVYSEDVDLITVKSEINNAKVEEFGESIDKILDSVIDSINENIGYYFIKEIELDLDRKIGPIFRDFGISIYDKQKSYEINLAQMGKIRINEVKNSELLLPIFNALVSLINGKKKNSISIDNIQNSLTKLINKYEVFKTINIKERHDSEGYYEIDIDPEVDKYILLERAEIIENLLINIGRSLEFEQRYLFIDSLNYCLTPKDISNFNRIGLNFKKVKESVIKEEQKLLIKKIIEVIITILENKLSTEDAVKNTNDIIENIKIKHEILKYIKFDLTQSSNGIDAVNVLSKINSEKSRNISKALKDVLIKTHEQTRNISPNFIEEFEKRIGPKYIDEMEKIGLNINILKMKYSLKKSFHF